MEYRSYVGRDFCEHWVGRSTGKLTVGGCMRKAAEKLRRGVFAVTQVEGCLEFICRNDAALCFPHWGCRYRSVMPPWRDADTFGTQLFATDQMHSMSVKRLQSALDTPTLTRSLVCYKRQCMHSAVPRNEAIPKALCTAIAGTF